MNLQIFTDKEVDEMQSGMSASAKDIRQIESAMIDRLPGPPMDVGNLLWVHFMDFCKTRRFAPADFSDLFKIIKPIREASSLKITEVANGLQLWNTFDKETQSKILQLSDDRSGEKVTQAYPRQGEIETDSEVSKLKVSLDGGVTFTDRKSHLPPTAVKPRLFRAGI